MAGTSLFLAPILTFLHLFPCSNDLAPFIGRRKVVWRKRNPDSFLEAKDKCGHKWASTELRTSRIRRLVVCYRVISMFRRLKPLQGFTVICSYFNDPAPFNAVFAGTAITYRCKFSRRKGHDCPVRMRVERNGQSGLLTVFESGKLL